MAKYHNVYINMLLRIPGTPYLIMIGDWAAFLCPERSVQDSELFRLHERTARPLGSDKFIAHLQKMIGRRLGREKPGPKNKSAGN
jgi:hypothetical protein